MKIQYLIATSAGAIALLTVSPARAQDQSAQDANIQGQAAEAEAEADAIVVTGIRASLEQSIEQKREAAVVMDTINAEDIGKMPDNNVAESLQRVTGIQINRGFDNNPGDNFGSGQGTQISARGIRPDLNRTLLNGQPLGTNTDGRNFDFSAVSPQLVKRLEVLKSPSASQIEGALGAIVNQVTRKPLDARRIRGAVSAQLEYPEFTKDKGYRVEAFLSVPVSDNFGIVAGFNRTDVMYQRHRYETAGWTQRAGIRDVNGVTRTGLIPVNFRYNNRIEDIERDNYFAGIQWQPTEELELNVNYLHAKAVNHNYGVQPILPAEIATNAITNAIFDGDVVVAGTVTASTAYRRMLAIDRFNNTTNDSIAGDLTWEKEGVTAKFSAGFSKGRFYQFFNIFNQFWGRDNFTFDFRGPLPLLTASPNGLLFANPSSYSVGLSNRSFNDYRDKERYAQLDFEFPTESLGFVTAIKTGVRWNRHDHSSAQANDVTTAAERAGVTLADFILPPVANGFSVGTAGGVPSDFPAINFDALIARFDPVLQTFDNGLNPAAPSNQATGNYGLKESVMAGYVQLDFGTGPVTGNVGVRYVLTDQDNTGYNFTPAVGATPARLTAARFGRTYTDILPSFNIRWQLTDKLQLRGALSKAMARPSIRDLNLGGNVIVLASTATVNNPALEPFRANAADLSLEWYFEKQGLLSAALFYKDIKSFVQTNTTQGTLPGFGTQVFTIQTLSNGPGAKLKGFEVALQKNFNFLPSPLDGFGTLLNYTYVDAPSRVNDPVTGNALPLPGVSKNTFNAILFYEKAGLQARVAYSLRSSYVAFASTGAYTLNGVTVGLPIYRDKFAQLDANLSYEIPGTGATVFVAGSNLLNEDTYDYAQVGQQQLFTSYHKSGRVYNAGVRFRF